MVQLFFDNIDHSTLYRLRHYQWQDSLLVLYRLFSSVTFSLTLQCSRVHLAISFHSLRLFFLLFFVILSAIIFFPSPQAPALPIWFSSSDSDTPGNIQMLLIQTSTSYKDIRNWIITNLNLMTIKPKPFLLAHAQSLLSFFVSSLSNLTRQCNYTTIVKFLFLTANSLGIAPNGSPSWW